jgi:hypothetical protein
MSFNRSRRLLVLVVSRCSCVGDSLVLLLVPVSIGLLVRCSMWRLTPVMLPVLTGLSILLFNSFGSLAVDFGIPQTPTFSFILWSQIALRTSSFQYCTLLCSVNPLLWSTPVSSLYLRRFAPVVRRSAVQSSLVRSVHSVVDGHLTLSALVVVTDGHNGTVRSCMLPVMFPWTSILITCLILLCSMLRPSTVDRIAGLFFQSSVGLFPCYLSIVSIIAPVSTGLLSLLALSVVEVKPCRLL